MKALNSSRLTAFAVLGLLTLALVTNTVYVSAIGPEEAQVTIFKYICMTVSVCICAIAGAVAVMKTGVASVASITEKPELFGRTIIYVGLAEGIAIYGLLVSLLIWIG
ncbi:V-type ATP synthase subunit K [Candidatus Geothermarchaeota archaeon]|nr:MAG: V-type ATP synthase subunit K [Candidatus Geothermarchaeota archaeon]